MGKLQRWALLEISFDACAGLTIARIPFYICLVKPLEVHITARLHFRDSALTWTREDEHENGNPQAFFHLNFPIFVSLNP